MSNWVKPPNIKFGRVLISYRGWRIRPFIRLRTVRIGKTRLYCLGPISIFVDYVR